MRKKREVQIFLEQGRKIRFMICNKNAEKRMFKEMALSVTVNNEGERVQASGSQSRMADLVNESVDTEAEIDALINTLRDTLRNIIKLIDQVENPTFYNILHLRYVQFKEFEDIGTAFGKDYNWATTNHGRALVCAEEIFRREKHH